MKLKKQTFGINRIVSSLLPMALLAVAGEAGAAETLFKPSLSIGEEFTDNVFLSSTVKKSDYITKTRPGFTSKYNAPFWEWDVSYAYDYRYYVNGSRKNDYTQDVNAKGLIKLVEEKVFLELSDTYKRVSLDLVRDTTTESLFVNQTDVNTAVVSPYVILRPATDIVVKTGYRYINTIYKSSTSFDKVHHVGFVDASYLLSEKLKFDVDYSFTRQDSDFQQYNRHTVYVGPRYEYADKSFVFAQGGASITDYSNNPHTDKPVWKAGITHTFDSMVFTGKTDAQYVDNPLGSPILTTSYDTSLKKIFSRGDITALASYKEYSASTVNSQSMATLASNGGRTVYTAGFTSSYELLEKLKGTLGFTFNYYKYDQTHSITRQYLANTGFVYDLGDDFTLGVSYQYNQYTSAQLATDNRKVNRAMLDIKKVF